MGSDSASEIRSTSAATWQHRIRRSSRTSRYRPSAALRISRSWRSSYASGSLQVTAAAANISMLSPQISVYTTSGTLLAQASNPSAWSDNVTATIPSVVPGERYNVAVTGDTGTYFDVGEYSLVVSLPQSKAPSAPVTTPTPVTPTPTPVTTPTPTATNTTPQTATRLGWITQTTLPALVFNSASTVEFFDFKAARGRLSAQCHGSDNPGVQRPWKIDCPGYQPGKRFQ